MAVKKAQPKIGTIILLLLLIAGAAILYWFFFLKPALSAIGDLRGTNCELNREIDALTNKLGQKPEIEQKWSGMREQEGYLLAKIPEAAVLPQVFGDLEQLVLSSPVEIREFNAGEFQDGEGYRVIPISLHVSGPAEELLLLLERLEQFTHMTLSEKASIEESEGLHRLSVNFNLIFIPEGQAKTVGPEENQG